MEKINKEIHSWKESESARVNKWANKEIEI
jgi:hypothetical protein